MTSMLVRSATPLTVYGPRIRSVECRGVADMSCSDNDAGQPIPDCDAPWRAGMRTAAIAVVCNEVFSGYPGERRAA